MKVCLGGKRQEEKMKLARRLTSFNNRFGYDLGKERLFQAMDEEIDIAEALGLCAVAI